MKGGQRTGAWRKPCTDKKQQITTYVLTSHIEKLDKDLIRQVCEKAINEGVQISTSTEAQNPTLGVGAVSTRFFFRQDDAICYKIDAHIDYMLFNGIAEMDLFLAEREKNAPYFFCKHFGEIGEKSEGGCGKLCNGYEARNGKSGACKHYGYTYEQTDICFTLKLYDDLVSQNEC